MPIAPRKLDASAIIKLSAIDGALILDAEGMCHVFGTILDGAAAAGRGTLSRGGRRRRFQDSDVTLFPHSRQK